MGKQKKEKGIHETCEPASMASNRLKKLSPPRNPVTVIKNSLTWKIGTSGEEGGAVYIRLEHIRVLPASGSDNTSVTKGRRKERERERKGEGLTRRGMKSRIIGQIERLSLSTGCQRVFTTPLLPVYVDYLHLALSTYRRPSTRFAWKTRPVLDLSLRGYSTFSNLCERDGEKLLLFSGRDYLFARKIRLSQRWTPFLDSWCNPRCNVVYVNCKKDRSRRVVILCYSLLVTLWNYIGLHRPGIELCS